MAQNWAVLVRGFSVAGRTVSRERTIHHPYADHLEGHLAAVRQLTALLLLQYSHRVPLYPKTHNRTRLWACHWPWTFFDTAREMG